MLNPLHHIVHIVVAAPAIGEALVFQLVRRGQNLLEQLHPAAIHIRRDNDPAVLGLQRLAAGIDLALVTERPDRRIEHGFVEMLLQQEMRDAFEHRHFHMHRLARPVALAKRGKRRVDRMQAGHLVGKGCRNETRSRIAIDLRQQARRRRQALDQIVISRAARIRPLRAEAEAMDVDNVWLDRFDLFEGQTKPRHGIRADIVDEHIATLDQTADGFLAFIGLHVPHDRALAAIDRHVARAHVPIVGRLADIAEIVAAGGLDLDHVSAHISQGLGAIRPENHRRHVSNSDIGQHACSRHGHLPVFWLSNGTGPAALARAAAWVSRRGNSQVSRPTGTSSALERRFAVFRP